MLFPGGVINRNGKVTDAQDTSDRLRRAVKAAAAGTGSPEELQQAARALADELRGRDEPPEQVLIQIKALLADAGIRFGHPASDGSAELYRDIITWAIRAYYSPPSS